MEEQKNDLDEQIKFSQLLKELAETQATLAKIDAQIAIKEGKDQVKSTVESTKTTLETQAKKFGANLKKVEEDYRNGNEDKKGILEEYESLLEEVNGNYHTLMQDVLEKKAQLEVEEQENMMGQKKNKIDTRNAEKEFSKQEKLLKAEIIKATKEKRLEDAQQRIAELQDLTENNPVNSMKTVNEELQTRRTEIRGLIEECEKQYEKLMEERKKEIDGLTEDKNNKLAKIPKQNIFQKTIGSIFNKFNGTKKFMKTAVEPLKAKITEIKEEDIPRLKQEIGGKRQQLSDKIQGARTGIEETVKGKVDEYATKLAQNQQKAMESVKNMRNTVIGKADKLGQNVINTKDNFVQGAKDTKASVVDAIKNGKNAIIQGAKSTRDNVTSHVTSTIDTGKRTFRNVIGKGLQMKMNFIKSAQDRLNEQQKEIEKKMQILNPELDKKESGKEISE